MRWSVLVVLMLMMVPMVPVAHAIDSGSGTTIVHVTDLHIRLDDRGEMHGPDELVSCIASMEPRPSLVIISGDIGESGGKDPEGEVIYRRLLDAPSMEVTVNGLMIRSDDGRTIPVVTCPGNHDYRDHFPGIGSDLLARRSLYNYNSLICLENRTCTVVDGVMVLTLNSGGDARLHSIERIGDPFYQVRGEGVSDADLDWLETRLAEADERGLGKIVVTHHPLVDPYAAERVYDKGTGLEFRGSSTDNTMVEGAERLMSILDAHSVDLLLSGHDHEASQGPDGGVWDLGHTRQVITGSYGYYGEYRVIDVSDGTSSPRDVSNIGSVNTIRVTGADEVHAYRDGGHSGPYGDGFESDAWGVWYRYDGDSVEVSSIRPFELVVDGEAAVESVLRLADGRVSVSKYPTVDGCRVDVIAGQVDAVVTSGGTRLAVRERSGDVVPPAPVSPRLVDGVVEWDPVPGAIGYRLRDASGVVMDDITGCTSTVPASTVSAYNEVGEGSSVRVPHDGTMTTAGLVLMAAVPLVASSRAISRRGRR